MRKNFVDILKSAKIDIRKEYIRLYTLFFGEFTDKSTGKQTSIYEKYCECFPQMWFRKTTLSLEEFNKEFGFNFAKQPKNFSIDYLVNFCEYIYNLTAGYVSVYGFMAEINYQLLYLQIDRIIEAIGYMSTTQDGFTIFTEKSVSAIAVSEIIPNDLSYKVISYNHHSMKGNIEKKKETLLMLASLLEGKRKQLKSINSSLEVDLFYAFNNLNLRHNNKEISFKEKYNKFIAEMSDGELENWYDETYQMCLLAFLEIEQIRRKKSFNELKRHIEENT